MYNLSYFLTTYNKLPYLKIVLEDLIANRLEDEEIVISDGGSTDGTKEYLEKLFAEGKIDYFFSGKDKGESHGLNRAMLACTGTILKVLTDDDVYCYEAIREVKEYMLRNEDVDMIGADGYDNYTGGQLEFMNHVALFEEWKKDGEPFSFYGPGLFIKKASLSLTGLFNGMVKFIDSEYCYRATSLSIKLVWYSKPVFIRMINEESNTLKFIKQATLEKELTDVYRKVSTGRSIVTAKGKRTVNLLKRRAYDFIHNRSSQIAKNTFQNDILKGFDALKLQLKKEWNGFQQKPFID